MSDVEDARPSLAVLRHGPFARYMGCEGLSMVGTWMQTMAQGWVMATLTHSAMMLGLVNLAGGLPMVLLSMKGGAAADRFDKRWILLATQLAQVVLALGMGALIYVGQIRLEHVIIFALLQGISNAYEMPAANALVPEIVEKDQIAAAIAVDRSVFHATRLLGPSLAGIAIGAWGTASAFFANAVSFLPLTIALCTLPPRSLGTPEEEEQRGAGMKAGIDYVKGDGPTIAMIGIISMSTFFVFPAMTVLMPLYARDVLQLPAQGLGMLMSISAIGSLAGSALLMRIRKRQRLVALALAGVGAAVGLMGLSVAHNLAQSGVAVVLLAVSMSTQVGTANTIVQERAPGALRGRVSAIAGLSFFGLMPVAALVLSALSDLTTMRTALACSAAIFFVGANLMLAGPGRRALEVPTMPPQADPTQASG